MASQKVLLFCATDVDGTLLEAVFTEAGWDAEAVVDDDRFAQAIQWWKPDAVLLSVDAGASRVLDTVNAIYEKGTPPVLVVFGARPQGILEKIARDVGVEDAVTTLFGFSPLVECLRAVYDAAIAKRLNGPGGFADDASS